MIRPRRSGVSDSAVSRFGDEARSRNREYLIRRILWMLQAGAYGGLSAGAGDRGTRHTLPLDSRSP